MSWDQVAYDAELERQKNVILVPGEIYKLKSEPTIKFEILEVDETNNQAVIKTLKSGNIQTKTVYWCKKKLEKE